MSEPAYDSVIGLETHVQLKTATKMFCRCPNRFGEPPNTLVCPVCLGYPGTLPVVNRRAVDLATKLALALGCTVRERSVFARKNYFYPDLPKGYQISQYDRPLAEEGRLPLMLHDKSVRIERLHLEEDAGKLLHELPGGAPLPGESLVDFNRCGVPLVEIVSRPDIATAAEAADYLQTLHQLLLYTGTSDGNMEEGSLRCDANVSVRRPGETRLGTKTEVKNLNSFRNVARAIEHETGRQIALLEGGGRVVQETRGYDAGAGATYLLRSKEEAHDYRYFPEPDLPPLLVDAARREALAAELPELPWQVRARLEAQYKLSPEHARVIAQSLALVRYYESAVSAYPANPQAIANWLLTEVLRELKDRSTEPFAAMPPSRLAALVELFDSGAVSSTAAKQILGEMWANLEEHPRVTMERLGLGQVSDTAQIERWIEEVVGEHEGPVAQFRAGKTQTFGFLVGQVMKRSGGRADPKLVQQLLRDTLAKERVGGPPPN